MIQSLLLCVKCDQAIVFYMPNFSLCFWTSAVRFIYERFTFLVIFVVTSRLKHDRATLSVSVSILTSNSMKVWKTHTVLNTEKKLFLTCSATTTCTSRFVKLINILIQVSVIKVVKIFVYKSRADSMSSVTSSSSSLSSSPPPPPSSSSFFVFP